MSGPTAAFVVILAPILSKFGMGGLLVSGLLAGVILIALALARLGRLVTFVPHPVGGKTPAELREYGKKALSGIVGALTRPLVVAETQTGALERPVPRLLGADSEDALHALF